MCTWIPNAVYIQRHLSHAEMEQIRPFFDFRRRCGLLLAQTPGPPRSAPPRSAPPRPTPSKLLACLRNAVSKKTRKRQSRKRKPRPVNMAKQQHKLQASAEVEAAAAAAAAARSKSNSSKPSSATTAAPSAKSRSSLSAAPSFAMSRAGANGNAPTGSGPPSRPWDPKQELPTRGLINLGNTCFFNSAMQNVFHTRPLHEALFSDISGRRQGTYVGPLNKVFRKMLLEMSGEGPLGAGRG